MDTCCFWHLCFLCNDYNFVFFIYSFAYIIVSQQGSNQNWKVVAASVTCTGILVCLCLAFEVQFMTSSWNNVLFNKQKYFELIKMCNTVINIGNNKYVDVQLTVWKSLARVVPHAAAAGSTRSKKYSAALWHAAYCSSIILAPPSSTAYFNQITSTFLESLKCCQHDKLIESRKHNASLFYYLHFKSCNSFLLLSA